MAVGLDRKSSGDEFDCGHEAARGRRCSIAKQLGPKDNDTDSSTVSYSKLQLHKEWIEYSLSMQSRCRPEMPVCPSRNAYKISNLSRLC